MGIRQRRTRKHAKTHIVGFSAAGVLAFIALLCVALAVSLGALVESWLQDLPDYTSADAYLVAEPSQVYDANNNVIATFYLENRQSVTIDQVSDYVLKGTVDVEDERFYSHNGIDPIGIMRAVVAQLSGRSEGASTITQQLVRNTVLSDEQFDKTLKRKVREAYISIQMEKTYSKDQILMMYLNTIYYGHGAYGIESASITFFNKHASELTLAEAATLAGLPNSPSAYDPTVNPEGAKSRRNKVLDNMLKCGDITQEEHDAAQAEELVLNLGSTNYDNQGTYPYWTNYVKSLLEEDFSQDTIVQSGLKIYTTIDPTYQEAAQNAVEQYLSDAGVDGLDQALVAIDPSTGYIKAMVGGRDFYGEDSNAQVNAATSQRQAGSSFKMFTLVAAINAGMDPNNTYINCNSPITIGTDGTRIQNYGNDSYGTMSLQAATAISSNTGYVQVAQAIGLDQMISMAHNMGISSTLEAYLSTTLGAEEVTPLEMAESYATLAAGGLHRDAIAIYKIEDRNGNTVYEHTDEPTRVFEESVARAATEVLETVLTDSRGSARPMLGYLNINQPVAGKTGTTEYYDNLWFCGYTPQLAVSVWTGYKSGSIEVHTNYGLGHPYNTSCRTWAYFMNNVLSGVERANFSFSSAAYPEYKKASTWKFSNTSVRQSTGQEQSSDTSAATTASTTAATTAASSAAASSAAAASSPAASSPAASSPAASSPAASSPAAESPSQPASSPAAESPAQPAASSPAAAAQADNQQAVAAAQ